MIIGSDSSANHTKQIQLQVTTWIKGHIRMLVPIFLEKILSVPVFLSHLLLFANFDYKFAIYPLLPSLPLPTSTWLLSIIFEPRCGASRLLWTKNVLKDENQMTLYDIIGAMDATSLATALLSAAPLQATTKTSNLCCLAWLLFIGFNNWVRPNQGLFRACYTGWNLATPLYHRPRR